MVGTGLRAENFQLANFKQLLNHIANVAIPVDHLLYSMIPAAFIRALSVAEIC